MGGCTASCQLGYFENTLAVASNDLLTSLKAEDWCALMRGFPAFCTVQTPHGIWQEGFHKRAEGVSVNTYD